MAWNKNVKTDAFSNSIIASIARLSLVASSLVFIFVACGGDSGRSTKPADDGREVATVVDMGRCTNEREGDTVYVAEKMADYLCKNHTWVDLSTISDNEKSLSSSSVAKGTSSATPGVSSATQGTSSTTSETHATSSSSVVAPNSVSGTSAGKDENPNQEFIRENISVTGVAQKGPFKFGSPLNLYELKKDLNPSGRAYNDEINSNKGDFVIPKVSLAYPYAKLEVAGLYRNEVTGEWSKEPMTLFALTDFSDKRAQTNSDERVQVNINLLTHLEYDRALYLVQEKGYSVYAAKKQAAQEIMTAFEFATAVTYSEDFAIFQNDGVGSGTVAGNGTLLAISALVMGNRSDAEIQSVIDQFREDIKTDGEWNDLQTKANMADWAHDFKYSTIRAAVKSWNILDIPDYETYLDVYWNNMYGLGGCSEIRKGSVAPNSNKLSKYYNEYFICKVDGSKYSWVSATTIEKDTYKWAAGKSGEFKKGNVTDTIYTYNGSKWEVAARETSIDVCGSKNAGVVSKFNGTYYICKSNAWETATVLEYDTYGWKAGTEGSVKAGNVNTDKYYVYENAAWRASTGTIENNLGACVTNREGEVGESGSAYYICKSKTWTTATVLEYDTYGWNAGSEGAVKAGSVNSDKYYVYENGAWRASSGAIENNLGACVTSREGEKNMYNNKYYICENKKWKSITAVEYALGLCTTSNNGVIEKMNGVYYICKSGSWTTATVLEYDTYGWSAGVDGEVKVGSVNKNKYYIYKNGAWQTATSVEQNLGGCTVDRDGEVDLFGNSYYICKNKTWTFSSVDSLSVVKGTMVDARDGQTYKTVTIGSQTWMAENLNIEYVLGCCGYGSGCCCSDETKCSEYLAKYGRLYKWSVAMDSAGKWSSDGIGCGYGRTCSRTHRIRGVCPEGWHLPDTTEWKTLFTAVGGRETAGKMLKSTSGWNKLSNGTDSFSFSVLPAGEMETDTGDFSGEGDIAYFWSSSEDGYAGAYMFKFNYYGEYSFDLSDNKIRRVSVRCLKD